MNQTVNSSIHPTWHGLEKKKTLAYYVATVLRVESIVFNLCLLLLMFILKLDKKMYRYLELKSTTKACGFILLLICDDELIVPMIQYPATYVYESNCSKTWDIFKVQVLPIVSKILINVSMMTEVPMIYDRICLLKNTNDWLTHMKVRYTFCVMLAICCIFFLPEIFTIEIDCDNANQTLVNMTLFGKSKYYKLFFYISGALKMLLAFFYLVILIRIIYYYRKSPQGLLEEFYLTQMVIAVGFMNIFNVGIMFTNITFGIISRYLEIQFLGSLTNEVLIISSYLINGNTVLAAFYFDQHINKFMKKCIRKTCGNWKC